MPYVKNSVNYRTRSRRSRARKRRIAGILSAVAIAIVATFVLRARTGGDVVSAAVRRTPSPAAFVERRREAPPWGAAARTELQTAVRDALAPATDGAVAWSCVVIAQDGDVLYDDRARNAVEPASTEKLIVTDAALTDLGPRFRFDTLFAATQAPRDGKIDGDIWLAGSGDPSLRSSDLRSGGAVLRKEGIDGVTGRLVVDGSAIAGEEINPLWNADDANEDFMAATSGISIDEDTVEFDVTGTSPGQPAQVRIHPMSSDVTYSGSVATGGGDEVIVAATQTPNDFRLDGNIPPGVEEKYWVPVHGIAQYAAAVTDRILRTGGVAVQGPPLTGTVPIDAHILWEHRSQPLPALLGHMLVVSDNHFAEQLMRTVGASNGSSATDRDGIAQEVRILQRQGIPTPGLHLVDGSGLAHANRVAAITLARILAHFDADPAGNQIYPLLPRGGRDGTLENYQFTTAAGRVRAKTGHLADASSLVGYVNTREHGRVVFAFLINGSPGDPDDAIVSAVDRIAAL